MRPDRPGLGLARATRLPVLSALKMDLHRPVVLVTNHDDLALKYLDELGFWLKDDLPAAFSGTQPVILRTGCLGTTTRRDRLLALTSLAVFHIPGGSSEKKPPVIVTTARALMTRTLPRRDFIKYSKVVHTGQTGQPETLVRGWVDIGYEGVQIVTEPGHSHVGAVSWISGRR